MAIFVNLDKPLISQILVNGKPQKIEYESLPTIYFSYGWYCHVKDLCLFSVGDKGNAGVNDGSMATGSTIGDSVEDVTQFGPWMIVERRPCWNLKEPQKLATQISEKDEAGS